MYKKNSKYVYIILSLLYRFFFMDCKDITIEKISLGVYTSNNKSENEVEILLGQIQVIHFNVLGTEVFHQSLLTLTLSKFVQKLCHWKLTTYPFSVIWITSLQNVQFFSKTKILKLYKKNISTCLPAHDKTFMSGYSKHRIF